MDKENQKISGLVRKLQGGDKSAFEEIYKLTAPKAYFVALKICKNEHDAEDILQESFLKVLEKIDTVDPDKNFTAWLYQIVANKSRNYINSKKPVLFPEDEKDFIGNLPEENLQFSPEEQVDREELRAEVMAAVDELTAEKRACVMMMYFGDMSVNEIAESLEIPVGTVKNRLFTARKDLKDKFERKNITSLYSAAPLGVVVWAIAQTSDKVATAFAAGTASAAVMTTALSASSTASTAGSAATTAATAASATTATASTAAATGTGIAAKVAAFSVAQKVVAGVAAASVIGGSTAGVATVVKNNIEENKTTTAHTEEVTTAPSQTEEYVFAVVTTDGATGTTEVKTVVISESFGQTSIITRPAETEQASVSDTETATEEITEKASNKRTTVRTTIIENKPTSTTAKATTTLKNTTTEKNKETTTQEATTTQSEATTENATTTAKATTTKATTVKATTTKATTTAKPTTTVPTTVATTVPTTAAPTTTAPETTTAPTTLPSPATVTVEVTDMDDSVVATFNLSVPAGTQMTNEYLVTLIKAEGYEPQAGIYGDAVGATAESGKTYNITAEL